MPLGSGQVEVMHRLRLGHSGRRISWCAESSGSEEPSNSQSLRFDHQPAFI